MINVLDLAEYILFVFIEKNKQLNVLFLSKIIFLIQEHFFNKDILIINETSMVSKVGPIIDKVWYSYLVKAPAATNFNLSNNIKKEYEEYMKEKYGEEIIEEIKELIIKYLELGSLKTTQILYGESKLYNLFKDKEYGTEINLSKLSKII